MSYLPLSAVVATILLVLAAAPSAFLHPSHAHLHGGVKHRHNLHVGRKSGGGGSFNPAMWQGELIPLLPNSTTLLDISLPGTHDTTTYDLTTSISDNANDLPADLASLLHDIGPIVNGIDIGNFIRTQAFTQHLNVTEQLNSGIRFIDFRVTYSAPPGVPSSNTSAYDWYGLHLLQTRTTALTFLAEVRNWLMAHPTEFVVVWVSRHGCACCTTFQVDTPILQQFWSNIVSLFTPEMIVNQKVHPINTTSLSTMFTAPPSTSPQVIFYLAEYARMTQDNNNPDLAQSDCNIDNDGNENVVDPLSIVDNFKSIFDNTSARIEKDSAINNFYLVSMAGAPGSNEYMTIIFLLYYFNYLQLLATATNVNSVHKTNHEEGSVNQQLASKLLQLPRGDSENYDYLQARWKEGRIVAEKLLGKVNRVLVVTTPADDTVTAISVQLSTTIDDLVRQCASLFLTPGVTDWCPRTIIQSSQFKNYYDQIAFEYVVTSNIASRTNTSPLASSSNSPPPPRRRFPNAIYINAIGTDGTLQTGDATLYPYPTVATSATSSSRTKKSPTDAVADDDSTISSGGGSGSNSNLNAKYFYLNNLALVTMIQLCGPADAVCNAVIDEMIAARDVSPFAAKYWSSPSTGRVMPPPPH